MGFPKSTVEEKSDTIHGSNVYPKPARRQRLLVLRVPCNPDNVSVDLRTVRMSKHVLIHEALLRM